jgi:hypothetical protein
MMTMIYKGFKFSFNDPAEKERHMKTIDDYENEQQSIPMDVDAARVALSHMTACRSIKPMTADQATQLKRITLGLDVGSLAPALAPNRIESRHFTRSSRVRNLVHGGMVGVLAVRVMNDSSQVERRSRTWNSWRILRRVNGQAGCEHVIWSIPEFQCRHNIGINHYKRSKSCFDAMSIDETNAELNAMNTPENRQQFIDDCNALANRANHSRVKCVSVVHEDECTKCERQFPLANKWITKYISAFTKVCSHKMGLVSVNSLCLIDRAMNLVDLHRFVSSSIDWILMDCSLRFVCKLHTLWPKYMERLVYMSQESIEHSACMLSRYFPEMMTPELHVVVKSNYPYRMPGMQIADDDALFGPLKLACQGLLPDGVCERVVRARREARRDYESDDEFDRDYEDEEFDRAEDEEDDDYTYTDDDYSDEDDDADVYCSDDDDDDDHAQG